MFIKIVKTDMVWVQSPMLVRDGANAMMTLERIQSVTISYD